MQQRRIQRSSQRLIERSCDGQEAKGVGSGWAAGDALAGASAGGQVGASSAVLGGDRARAVERGCCGEAGVSAAVGVRWFREGGGMPSVTLAPASGRYLSFAEREEIAILRARGAGVGEIARQLGRSPSTISRELRRKAATAAAVRVPGTTAQWHADCGRGARSPRSSRSTPSCAAMCRTPVRGGAASDGIAVDGPQVRWIGRVTAGGRIGAGRGRGARSRSPTGCAWTSPMMSRCASLMRRSTSRSMCRAAARCGAS